MRVWFGHLFLGKNQIIKAIKKYLENLEITTKTRNFLKSYLKTPAIKVIGSPIIGNHAKSKEKAPNLSKYLFELSIYSW